MTDADFILIPKFVRVRFDLAPALNAIDSLMALLRVESLSGMGEWAVRTAASLSPELRRNNRLVMEGFTALFYDMEAVQRDWPDFPAFIDYLAAQDPVALRDQLCARMCSHKPKSEEPPTEHFTPEQLLGDFQAFVRWVAAFDHDGALDEPFLAEVHALLNDPPAMLKLVVSHLRLMWKEVVRPEWERVLPSLKETIAAFQQMDLSHVTFQEALRIVTGREMPALWEENTMQVDQITFVPSAHIGPYISMVGHDERRRLIFGAHLPRLVAPSTLSRSELLVRLNALTDDTRLRILELLAQEDELCAQDMIARLDLSQSSVSRHLGQLVSTGFVTERRRDVAKCYSLNPRRIEDTINALAHFLKQK